MKKVALVLVTLLWPAIAAWAADQEVVEIGVSGLACPFCAYGLEKNLSKLPDVDSAEVDLAASSARVVIKADRTADLEQIKQAIVKAGFTPGGATTSGAHE
jgi:copper chaperone CopZ